MVVLLNILVLIMMYQIIIKRNWLHPVIYFYGVFCISLLFTIVDLYVSQILISNTTIRALALGMIGFAFGSLPNIKIKIGIKRFMIEKQDFNYRMAVLYISFIISFIFNLYMAFTTINFLTNGYAYSSIRDLLFGYSGVDTSFFASSFLSTFNSWISTPCIYVLSTLLVLDLFERKINNSLKLMILIDLGMYIFATGGRLLIFQLLIQCFFLMQYYKISVPKKLRKRVIKLGLMLIGILFAVTFYRTKGSAEGIRRVSSIYAYFNIPLPLLSYWIECVDNSGIYGYGIGFLNGIMQLIIYLSSKLGIVSEYYDLVIEQIYLPQENWIQVYNGHWFNAFTTLFYNFYVDFRLPGVFIGTLFFGMICKSFYRGVCIIGDKRFLPAYLIVLQVISMAFIRWQFGTLTQVFAFALAIICVKKCKVR